MVILVLAWAVIACAAFLLSVQRGWLGPDAGRGGEFCELAADSLFRQPANTLSNLGFVLAGALIAVHASRRGGPFPRTLATAYALVVVTLGPASAAMHATGSAVGGDLDLLSMFLVSSFALAYAVARLARRTEPRSVVSVFLAALLAQSVLYRRGGRLPWIEHAGNLAFAGTLLAVVALEVALMRRAKRERGPSLDRRWLAATVAVLAAALVIWSVSKTGGPWCDPDSPLQGHALWHLLCAVAAYGLYRSYAGATPHARGSAGRSTSLGP